MDASSTRVWTWGLGKNGQLGHGSRGNLLSPKPLEALDSQRIVEVSCGEWHSAAVSCAGGLYTWGSGRQGQLGNNSWVGCVAPQRVQLLSSVTVASVSCGGAHTLVLTEDATVYSFGFGKHGQLGHGDLCNLHVPQLLSPFGSSSVVSVGAGFAFSGALTQTGEVFTWGTNESGQLGVLDPPDHTIPQQIDPARFGGEEAAALTIGGAHAGVITYSGAVCMWGDNTQGQLGTGSPLDANERPTQLNFEGILPPGAGVTRLSCGGSVSIATCSAGGCYVWGCAVSGQLRLRSRRCGLPETVDFGYEEHIDHVAAGAHHLLAFSSSNATLYCWGHGADGRLGTGDDAIQPEPTVVPELQGRTVLLAVGGNGHSAALSGCGEPVTPMAAIEAAPAAGRSTPMITTAHPEPQLEVVVVDGKAIIQPLPEDPQAATSVVSEGQWELTGSMQPDSTALPCCQMQAEVVLSGGRFWSEQAAFSACWEGHYESDSGRVSWMSSTAGGEQQFFDGLICEDGIRGRYSIKERESGSFWLSQQGQGSQPPAQEMSHEQLVEALSVSNQSSTALRARLTGFRDSEDAMRAELNLALLDKQNLEEQMLQLKLRAEAAEAKIDEERSLRADAEDKTEKLSEKMIGFKLREDALVRQLREKEAVARRAVDAFHGLRAECATLLGAAATAAFDEDGTELQALQSKLSELSKSPSKAAQTSE